MLDLPLIMTRVVRAFAMGCLVLLAGCAGKLVEVPTERAPAVGVALVEGPIRCPKDTVLDMDDDPSSGAGSVPESFEGLSVLLCKVEYTTMRSKNGMDHFAVTQWNDPLTPDLRAAFDLPDRELRPARACAAAQGRDIVVYLVDAQRQAVRVVLPRDDPCSRIRAEVSALLPGGEPPADASFEVSRKSR